MGHIMDLTQPVTYGSYNGLTQPVTYGTYNGLITTCYIWDI